MSNRPDDLTPGQRVAWHRVRRGLSQEVLAGLVGRTEDWLSKIENDRAALDRLSVVRSLANALGISVLDIIGDPTLERPSSEPFGVAEVRAALMDYRQLSPLLAVIEAEAEPPQLSGLKRDLDQVMRAYQESQYAQMLRLLPGLLTQSQLATSEYTGDDQRRASRLAALTSQSAAMILTKVGQPDLAWLSAQRGLAFAGRSEDPAVIGSLFRSVVHALHSQDRFTDSKAMTRKAADFLRRELDPQAPGTVSIYGSLLLPGAVAAARAGDRATTVEYLAEAEEMAAHLGADANHLWTAFGPTNVKIHRVVTAMALGDVPVALRLIPTIQTRGLPTERRVRHALEVVNAYHARNKVDEAIDELLNAERRAPEQVHEHVMSRQLVLKLRGTILGRKSKKLADLARRMRVI